MPGQWEQLIIDKTSLKVRREVLIELFEGRFGQLPPQIFERLDQFSVDELKRLNQSILHANSLAELGLAD